METFFISFVVLVAIGCLVWAAFDFGYKYGRATVIAWTTPESEYDDPMVTVIRKHITKNRAE